MNKVKIFRGTSPAYFQDNIDEWTKKENPNILNTSISISDHYSAISIVYSDNSSKELDLLRS